MRSKLEQARDITIRPRLPQRSPPRAFGLGLKAARDIVAEVARVVDRWTDHFRHGGVAERDIEVLAQYLDGEHLRRQRREFVGG